MPPSPAFEVHEANLHGHRAVYRTIGSGPTVVLIHGMINSSRHWETVAQRLAGSYRVIAPDLIGHGDAATPRGDYSLGAHAASIRDLLTTIGVERATIAGHSLGGGVAMQFFYQFPQRTERLVLISSGGLGYGASAASPPASTCRRSPAPSARCRIPAPVGLSCRPCAR
jgi:pimeloyl-ACP methyl ester carboxylesterase